jgi:hypothetical protein
LPDIQNVLVDVYGPQGLVAIAIDNDAQDILFPESIAAFTANQGVDYQVAAQDTSTLTYEAIAATYAGSNPYPVDILIDKQGIMRYIAREYDPVALEAMVIELLAEPDP